MLLGGDTAVFRGHEGVRELQAELREAIEFHVEFAEIRDLGDRIVAIGRLRTRGRGSGKATHIWTYVDADKALEAAGR